MRLHWDSVPIPCPGKGRGLAVSAPKCQARFGFACLHSSLIKCLALDAEGGTQLFQAQAWKVHKRQSLTKIKHKKMTRAARLVGWSRNFLSIHKGVDQRRLADI